MKKIAILLIILFASCEAPSSGVSEADANTFEKNVQTIKDSWIKGYQEENAEKVLSFMADSIQWTSAAGDVSGKESLSEAVQYWIDNFEDFSFTEAEGLEGTDVGYWGGNTYPVEQAMSGPNNVRMYGTWRATNSKTGKTGAIKSYVVLNFNADGQVHTATEYGDYGSMMSTFDE